MRTLIIHFLSSMACLTDYGYSSPFLLPRSQVYVQAEHPNRSVPCHYQFGQRKGTKSDCPFTHQRWELAIFQEKTFRLQGNYRTPFNDHALRYIATCVSICFSDLSSTLLSSLRVSAAAESSKQCGSAVVQYEIRTVPHHDSIRSYRCLNLVEPHT